MAKRSNKQTNRASAKKRNQSATPEPEVESSSSSSASSESSEKYVEEAADGHSQQAMPAASETGPKQPLPHDPKSDFGTSEMADRFREAKDDQGTRRREPVNAVDAARKPVQAPRSQDADPNANRGVTITTEAGKPVAHPGSTLK